MLRMTWNERLAFLNWRNPQYQGPFSCLNETGYRLTWIPSAGVVSAESPAAARLLRLEISRSEPSRK